MNRNDFISNDWIKPALGEIDQLPEDIEPGHQYYKLEGRKVVPSDMMEWAMSIENRDGKRQVANTSMPDGVNVSTVLLGLDHNFGVGPPLIFETMIFGGEHDSDTWRCSTYSQAEKQHQEALEMLK